MQRSLPLWRRQRAVCLTATSGAVENLRLLLCSAKDSQQPAASDGSGLAGCGLPRSALAAAAGAGQLRACQALLQLGCHCTVGAICAAARAGHLDVFRWLSGSVPLNNQHTWEAAAEGGQQAVCALLLARGGWSDAAQAAGARSGHVQLLRWLLDASAKSPRTRPIRTRMLLCSAAFGCELAVLRELWAQFAEQAEAAAEGTATVLGGGGGRASRAEVLLAAACSPTADYRDKVQWLLRDVGAELQVSREPGCAATSCASTPG